MPRKNHASAQLETQKRRDFVAKKRRDGYTYREIVDAAIIEFGQENLPDGWDALYAYKDIKRELEKYQASCAETVEEIRQIELDRLENLYRLVYPMAEKGSLPAVDRLLRIMERRAKYLPIEIQSNQDDDRNLTLTVIYEPYDKAKTTPPEAM